MPDLFLFVIFWGILMSLGCRLFKLEQIATYGGVSRKSNSFAAFDSGIFYIFHLWFQDR